MLYREGYYKNKNEKMKMARNTTAAMLLMMISLVFATLPGSNNLHKEEYFLNRNNS